MSLALPNLDDKTYGDLVAEAQASIPALYPAWTNHNPTDPGIVIIELLAWLTEQVIYRTNQVPAESYGAFLRLLDPTVKVPPDNLAEAIRSTLLQLREPYRAVTCADYEYLALQQFAKEFPDAPKVKRAHALAQRDLTSATPTAPADGHISLVVVLDSDRAPPRQPTPDEALLDQLWRFLDDRRLLGARHHVVGPTYLPVTVDFRIVPQSDAVGQVVYKACRDRLYAYFDPLQGGAEQIGWPLGRAVYHSEIYQILDATPGVDYVEEVIVQPATGDSDRNRVIYNSASQAIGVTLLPHELVQLHIGSK